MCGIVGYVGHEAGVPLLVAGCAASSTGATTRPASPSSAPRACRWCAAAASWRSSRRSWPSERPRGRSASATPAGRPTAAPREANAHPHTAGCVAVVHNGIIENHLTLRAAAGGGAGASSRPRPTPRSFAHLIDRGAAGRARRPGRRACGARSRQVRGHLRARGASPTSYPSSSWRRRTPRRWCWAWARARTSWPPTCRPSSSTRARSIFLEEGDVVAHDRAATRSSPTSQGQAASSASRAPSPGTPRRRRRAATRTSCSRRSSSSRAPSPTRCAAACSLERDDAELDGIEIDPRGRCSASCCWPAARRTTPGWSASSSSRRPGAHPLRGRSGERVPLPRSGRRRPGDLVIAISQSGETADTLAAVREAKAQGRAGAGDLQRGRRGDPARRRTRPLHARRARDRRGLDEVLHRAAGGAGAARDAPRAGGAAPSSRRGGPAAGRGMAGATPSKMTEALERLGDVVEASWPREYRLCARLSVPRARGELSRSRSRARSS